MTHCNGGNCKEKVSCKRFTSTEYIVNAERFSTPPMNEDGSCDMYWGVNQISILDQLKQITNDNSKENI